MKSRHMNDLRSLVIGRTSPKKPSFSDRCLERLGRPKIKGIRRLDIVVPVNHKVRPRFFAPGG